MWLDQAVRWLLPREEHFFDLLERGAACAIKTSELLVQVCAASPDDRSPIIASMIDEEHAADKVIHEVYDALNKTFVTPIDRSDIFTLATALENIVDAATATVLQLDVHAIEEIPAGSVEIAREIKNACNELCAAVKMLRGMKKLDACVEHCKAVYAAEHDGDQIFRKHLGQLFKTEKDAIKLLKSKEFLEGLERTLDECDDVANALETLAIKHA